MLSVTETALLITIGAMAGVSVALFAIHWWIRRNRPVPSTHGSSGSDGECSRGSASSRGSGGSNIDKLTPAFRKPPLLLKAINAIMKSEDLEDDEEDSDNESGDESAVAVSLTRAERAQLLRQMKSKPGGGVEAEDLTDYGVAQSPVDFRQTRLVPQMRLSASSGTPTTTRFGD